MARLRTKHEGSLATATTAPSIVDEPTRVSPVVHAARVNDIADDDIEDTTTLNGDVSGNDQTSEVDNHPVTGESWENQFQSS